MGSLNKWYYVGLGEDSVRTQSFKGYSYNLSIGMRTYSYQAYPSKMKPNPRDDDDI